MSKNGANKTTQNILKEDVSSYGFAHKSEIEKLKENVFRSDKEKFLLFSKMLRRSAMLKKAVITHKQ
jgi:hypothetical protein